MKIQSYNRTKAKIISENKTDNAGGLKLRLTQQTKSIRNFYLQLMSILIKQMTSKAVLTFSYNGLGSIERLRRILLTENKVF